MADHMAGPLQLNGIAKEVASMAMSSQRHENQTQQARAHAGVTTPTVEFKEITLEEKVGHGSYGVVYRAMWRERPVAVKEFGPSTELKAIETEVKQLSRVSHPNIIALYGISTHQQSKYLIMEYAEGGSLHNFLHGKVQPAYSMAHAMDWVRQCAEGVAYLHAMTPKPLIHRDLKPLNLLLTNKGRLLKICDFGTVADKSTLMTNNRGSAAWMAPEVFESTKYTEKCDIFSWGIVLWEVLSRKQPFKDVDNSCTILWKIHKGERPPLMPNCPERIQTLMTSCWKSVPEERPSMKYVVSVMNEIVACYPGAEKPLDYLFINQQIITKDTCTTNEQFIALSTNTGSSYSSNDSNITSMQMTPTNVPTNSNTSDELTPTNAGSLGSNVSTAGEGLFQPQTSITKVPQASIVSSNRWGAIPEEESQPESPSDGYMDSFKLTPSAEAAKRFDTIRNVMIQAAANPMPPLTLDVGTNAFELTDTDNDISLAKSDGKERLTVTDDKLMPLPAAVTTTTTANMNDTNNNNNNNNSNHDENDATADEVSIVDDEHEDSSLDDDSNMNDGDDNDDTDQSLTEMLDPELQPQPPIPNNAESQAIYREHRRLGKEYLRTVESIYYAQDFKEKLTLQMDLAERIQKQDLLLKMKEKEDLTTFYNNLKQQFEKMCADESITTDANNPNKSPAQQQHFAAAHGQLVNDGPSSPNGTASAVNANTSSNGGGGSGGGHGEMLSDDGWVVIAPN